MKVGECRWVELKLEVGSGCLRLVKVGQEWLRFGSCWLVGYGWLMVGGLWLVD